MISVVVAEMFLLSLGLGLSKSLHGQLCLSEHVQLFFPNFQCKLHAEDGGLSSCLGPLPLPPPRAPPLPEPLLPRPPLLPRFEVVAPTSDLVRAATTGVDAALEA